MTQIRVELPEALTSMPVKAFLTQHEGISSTQWKRIKHSGTFRVGGILCNAARTEVKTGDIISFDIVRLSELVAFVSYQIRVAVGLQFMRGLA